MLLQRCKAEDAHRGLARHSAHRTTAERHSVRYQEGKTTHTVAREKFPWQRIASPPRLGKLPPRTTVKCVLRCELEGLITETDPHPRKGPGPGPREAVLERKMHPHAWKNAHTDNFLGPHSRLWFYSWNVFERPSAVKMKI